MVKNFIIIIYKQLVAIHLPLDSLSGRGSYGMKGEMPLVKRDDVFLNSQEVS
jgi:hypothetical protein